MNITEIAKLAGVSKAAVSRYFNGGYLSAEKSEAVRRVVEQTGYEPNVQAQMLRRQRTRQIGVVLPKLSSESCARVTDGISSVLSGYGYQLMLANTANDPSKEIAYLDLLRRHHVEGVIFLASIFTPEHDSVLKNMHIPVVIVGQRHAGYNCVYHDDRGAAEAVTSLMLRHGCRRPGYIGVTAKDHAAGYERLQGYLQALKAAGLHAQERFMKTAAFNMDAGYEKAKELLCERERPDGIFCATDNIAVGAMQYCRKTGLRIPQDVMVAGIGDSRMAQVTAVPLTSAHLFYKTSGEEAAQMMLTLLQKHTSGTRSLQLGFQVAERESTHR